MSQVQTAQKDTINDPSSDACSLRVGMSRSEVLSVVPVDVGVAEEERPLRSASFFASCSPCSSAAEAPLY
jgi:hypothetical protein